MPLPDDLNSTDLSILLAIARLPGITTHDLEKAVFLSKSQVLRRLKPLEEQELITKRNGELGKTFYWTLHPSIAAAEVELLNLSRLTENRDPVAREAITVLLEAFEEFSDRSSEVAVQIRSILGRI